MHGLLSIAYNLHSCSAFIHYTALFFPAEQIWKYQIQKSTKAPFKVTQFKSLLEFYFWNGDQTWYIYPRVQRKKCNIRSASNTNQFVLSSIETSKSTKSFIIYLFIDHVLCYFNACVTDSILKNNIIFQ